MNKRTICILIVSTFVGLFSVITAQTKIEEPLNVSENVASDADADTISYYKETNLDELVVEARRGWVEDDKIVFVPDKHEKNLSNTAPGLLQSMQLPMVKVEGNSVIDRTGHNVTIFINGVKASETDLSTFWPKKAVRVEYIEHPDISKYGTTGTIVNFIMHDYATGGIVKFDGWQMYPFMGWYNVASKIEYKRMTYGMRVDAMFERSDMNRK